MDNTENMNVEAFDEDVPARIDPNELSKEDLLKFYRLIFPELKIETIGTVLQAETRRLGDEGFVEELKNLDSYPYMLKKMLDEYTDQIVFAAKALEHIKNPRMVSCEYEYRPVDEAEKPFMLKNMTLKLDKTFGGAEVQGRKAKMMIRANNKNIKKVYLYNSGFNIVLRAPSLLEVNLVYNQLEDAMNTYGRIMGAIFYMYSDAKTKEILWDFVEKLVVNSNFDNWEQPNALRETVSLVDFPLILLNIGTLIFKQGFDFNHICGNEACRHSVTELIDLKLLQLTDFSKVSFERLRWFSASTKVTKTDIETYRSELSFLSDTFVVGDNINVNRKVPTIGEYLDSGIAFNDTMARAIHDIRDSTMVDQYLRYNYCQIFMPWISSIEFLTENGEVSFKVTERDDIQVALDEIQKSGDHELFIEKMEAFMQNAIITHIGYLSKPCERCGYVHDGTVSGFTPFDVQSAFFSILVMRLIQHS
jgi:hypothetical protein